MPHRSISAMLLMACALAVLAPSSASAQDRTTAAFSATFVDPAAAPTPPMTPVPPADTAPPIEPASGPSKLMLPFYLATATLQALDVHSSFSALDAGAFEANPLLPGLVANRPAFVAVKVAMTVGIVYGASRLARHHRVLAIVALVGINSVYAALVSHNYHVAGVARARR
jgi:Domain of unknown function (DUF5658)